MQPDIDQVCGAIQDLQVRRKFIIKMETANTNMVKALVARMCGFDPNAEETAREKVWTRAGQIVRRALAERQQDEADLPIAKSVAPELEMVRRMLEPLLIRREEVEVEMARLAMELPVNIQVTGFKAIGLAVIVGEAGNLSNYATIRKLWRRFGLGMAPGHEGKAYSTHRRDGTFAGAPDEWIKAGYSPKRLGQVFGVVTVPLFMAKAKNQYGAVYQKRREHTAITHPDWTKGHSDMDARRVMVKAFLADLWREWRRSGHAVNAGRRLVDATNSVAA